MAPNMLPWSVSAIAGIPASLAAAITSSRRLAPSSRLYWLWRWRWTKSDMPGWMLPEGAPLGALSKTGSDAPLRPGAHLCREALQVGEPAARGGVDLCRNDGGI